MKKIKILALALWSLAGATAAAQSLILTDEELKVVQEHWPEMEKPVNFLAADALAGIEADYVVTPNRREPIAKLCQLAEIRKYASNYLYPDSTERIRHKRELESLFRDSINAILIPLNPNLTGRATGYALMMRRHLDLSPEKQDTLMEYALDYARRLHENPCANFAREEMDMLIKDLDAEQLTQALNAKNSATARLRSQQLWRAIVEAKLDVAQDSTAQVHRAYKYYNQELYIFDYFVEQPKQLRANLDDLYRHKPTIVKLYEGIGMRQEVIEKHAEKVGDEYAW